MKKIISASIMLVGIIFLAGCGTSSEVDETAKLAAILDSDLSTISDGPAEINGIISSMEGNKLIVKNEIGKEILSEEEAIKQKAERQAMTQEERQAIKEQEAVGLKTEDISLEIPVGVTILKGSGDGAGNSISATYEDLKKGTYVSIWIKDGVVETIKLKGI